MQIILLERIENLGIIGEEVSVKNGYARNFLLPKGKALIANARNRAKFEAERDAIEARNERLLAEARELGGRIDGASFVMLRQAGDTGQLYGSVTARDVADAAREAGYPVERRYVVLNKPIKAIGLHEVTVKVHADVAVTVTANVARSRDEAERQAAGENVIEALRNEQADFDREQAAELEEANAEAAAERAGGEDE
jgi:large subunit ribosomal protein L9